ncbi:hypothetical protein Krac_10938 [Ktedonobacter racemifer DSM 44963]|uniref:Uncharacterized protein n=1 Tax=Ktedonobacter racemifer DSM 44963 TaxID=485913 RepID=D6TIX9_KTERA|nr:hypothetical protein Krac_10938 [Ktedonobacter racemifer DSM 44963]
MVPTPLALDPASLPLCTQYLKMMTNMPIRHPFRRPAVWGELRLPLLLAPLAKGRSYFCVRCCTIR